MRYSEKKFDKKASNPIQVLVFTIYLVITSPYRLVSEISKKILYLDCYASKILFTALIMNTVLGVIEFVYGFFSERGLVLFGSTLNLFNLLVSFIIILLSIILLGKFKINVNMDKLEELNKDKPKKKTSKKSKSNPKTKTKPVDKAEKTEDLQKQEENEVKAEKSKVDKAMESMSLNFEELLSDDEILLRKEEITQKIAEMTSLSYENQKNKLDSLRKDR